VRWDQHPEPFWRKSRNCWYVQLGKKQIKLHANRDEAYRLYHELMSRPPAEQAATPVNPIPSGQVVELLDTFLEWARKNKAPHTYRWYKQYIQLFVDAIPATLTIAELKPYHVTCAMDAHPNWGNNSRHDFISAVKRAFNWALDEELIDRSPLARMKKPAREAGETVLSPAEYATVIKAVTEPRFHDLLEFAWETGARPQELRKVEARFLDLESSRIVFPPKQAKGKKYYRTIYLTDRARRIATRLAEENPGGPLLRNSEGNSWTKDAINCAFTRLEKKIGRKYHIGAFRKGYATEALKAGLDTVTVAHLLGHRDPSMVSKVYGQVQQDPEHMAKSARKAKRLRKAADA
jgi:integrase